MNNDSDSESRAKHIVFYDGYCVLCSRSIDFILSRDTFSAFGFASLQPDFAQRILSGMGYPIARIKNIGTIVYLRNDDIKTKSDAVLAILWNLGGIYKVSCLFHLFPRIVRDFGYDHLAKLRYRIFGKRDSCRIPTPQEMSRFLE